MRRDNFLMIPAIVYYGNRQRIVNWEYAIGLDRSDYYRKDFAWTSNPIPRLSPEYAAKSRREPYGKGERFFNGLQPVGVPIKRKIKVNLYYTGLTDAVKVAEQDREVKVMKMNSDHQVEFELNIPATSQTWFVIK